MKETRDIEALLTEAGFSFTVVERCPDPACSACDSDKVARAA